MKTVLEIIPEGIFLTRISNCRIERQTDEQCAMVMGFLALLP
jgi:hypothetical protein